MADSVEIVPRSVERIVTKAESYDLAVLFRKSRVGVDEVACSAEPPPGVIVR